MANGIYNSTNNDHFLRTISTAKLVIPKLVKVTISEQQKSLNQSVVCLIVTGWCCQEDVNIELPKH